MHLLSVYHSISVEYKVLKPERTGLNKVMVSTILSCRKESNVRDWPIAEVAIAIPEVLS